METKEVQMISSMVRLCGIQDTAPAAHSLPCNPIHALFWGRFQEHLLTLFPLLMAGNVVHSLI